MVKPRSSTQVETHREPRSCAALFLTVVLLMPACDEFPGLDAIGVQLNRAGSEIEIMKPLCPGDRVTDVSLFPAPGDNADVSRVLWEITSQAGSAQSSYVVGVTPPGFVQKVPLAHPIGIEQSVGAAIESNFDAQGIITFTPSELKTNMVLEPDGYFSPQQFEARHRDRCKT
jgi:hypothetical protein